MGAERRANAGKGRTKMVSQSGDSGAITSQTNTIWGESTRLKIKVLGIA